MAFLDKTGLQNLTNKLVDGETIRVSSSLGTTVKNVIDNITRECENISTPNTMKIENKVNEFKIGQGRDVNVVEDVETGYSEIELQGRTWQNLCGSSASVSIQYMDDFKIEDTEEYLKITRNAENYNGWFYFSNRTLKVNMLKPNTTYTVFFKYESINNNIPRLQFVLGNATQWLSDVFNSVRLKDNIYRCIIKTASSFEGKEVGKQVIYFHNADPKKTGCFVTLYKNMLLLEGDHSDLAVEEIPSFFTNIKSSFEDGVVDIDVQGKNLFDSSEWYKNNNTINVTDGGFKIIRQIDVSTPDLITDFKLLKKGTYCISTFWHGDITHSRIEIYNENGKFLDLGHEVGKDKSFTFTINEDTEIRFKIYGSNDSYTVIDSYVDIQLENSPSPTSYEPFYKKKISFNIGEPLRSLPNGTCDEIRDNNGQWELVRRVRKIVLNGSENWQSSDAYESFNRFLLKLNSYPWISNGTIGIASINDKVANRIIESHGGYEYVYIQGTIAATNCYYQLNTNKTFSLNGFKQWLSENPTTVYYELENPITTPIEPIKFETLPLGHISINSEIAPVSHHKVELNRAGQIERGIVEIASLKSRVEKLEDFYDQYFLETQHKLSILNMDYMLESEEI